LAEIAIKVTNTNFDLTQNQDGDILLCKNDRSIKACHASVICNPLKESLNLNGLRPDGLARSYYELIYEKRFERVSATEVLCTELSTGITTLIGATPNDQGQYMDVPLFVQRRLSNPHHKVFGSPGSEVWYGGADKSDDNTINSVWDHIEEHSGLLRTNHTQWPLTDTELSHFLVLPVDNPSDNVSLNMVSSEIDFDEQQPEFTTDNGPGGNIVKKHRAFISWRDLTGINVENILNPSMKIDLRNSFDNITISSINVKPRQNIWSVRSHLTDRGGLLVD